MILAYLLACFPGYAFTQSIAEKVAQAESQQKMVIWCFSVREFTEAIQGRRKVPVIR